MDATTDVFGCLAETLDAALRSGSSVEREPLEEDRRQVQAHSRVADQLVTYGQGSFCRECGEPAPCPTIRDLADRYGCADL